MMEKLPRNLLRVSPWCFADFILLLFIAVSQSFAKISAMDYSQKRNEIAVRYDVKSSLVEAGIRPSVKNKKQLKRLPHVFCRVLELPVRSDASVTIEEADDCFRFIGNVGCRSKDFRVEILKIIPGVVKVLVKESAGKGLEIEDLERWRVRLPSSTLPELSHVEYRDGVVIVRVPKDLQSCELSNESDGSSIEETRERLLKSLGSRVPVP
eukprot:TRINITY_DN2730_c0_g1_i2.p1 TRINITY_DN2730_c0_g1~~TRINITY_DN2730_c0_g1_i2.p1  ORF type:complete len:210 (-),score=35.41 TRINITY_DN2730_c0_g1_i2:320-949(-)